MSDTRATQSHRVATGADRSDHHPASAPATSALRGVDLIVQFMRDLNTMDCERLTLTPESTLSDDLGLNSLSILLLVVWIRDNVNKDVFDSVGNVASLVTVGDVLTLMDGHV